MSRLAGIPLEDMDDRQRALAEAITSGARGKGGSGAKYFDDRGALRGPFNAMLRSPEIGDAVQSVGEQIRFHSTLPGPLRELAILVCARHWRANYEWVSHAKIAKAEGLTDDVIDGVMNRKVPENPNEKTIYEFALTLNEDGKISDDLYGRTYDLLGEQGIVELTMLVGYYALISHTLNVFQVPVPAETDAPFED